MQTANTGPIYGKMNSIVKVFFLLVLSRHHHHQPFLKLGTCALISIKIVINLGALTLPLVCVCVCVCLSSWEQIKALFFHLIPTFCFIYFVKWWQWSNDALTLFLFVSFVWFDSNSEVLPTLIGSMIFCDPCDTYTHLHNIVVMLPITMNRFPIFQIKQSILALKEKAWMDS